MGRMIGLDISKHSAEVAVLEPGSSSCKRRRFVASPVGIRAFADKLGPDDSVALESCTNAFAFHRLPLGILVRAPWARGGRRVALQSALGARLQVQLMRGAVLEESRVLAIQLRDRDRHADVFTF